MIGDVDIDYFITQALKVIRSSIRSKSKQMKRNIFQETFVITNDLQERADATFSLTSPILENGSLATADELDELKKSYRHFGKISKTIMNAYSIRNNYILTCFIIIFLR